MRYHRFLPVFLIAFLIVACSGTSTQSNTTPPSTPPPQTNTVPLASPPKSGLRIVLVPTASKTLLNPDKALLYQRLSTFGLSHAFIQQIMAGNRSALQVEVPHFGGDEHTTLNTLLEVGQLALWDTGSQLPSVGTTLDPTQFAAHNPNDHPLFTNQDFDPTALSSAQDPTTRLYYLSLFMKPASRDNFSQFTASHIGNVLTITLDGKVIESASIQVQITSGTFQLSGLTAQRSKALFSVLKYAPLPVTLQESSEISF